MHRSRAVLCITLFLLAVTLKTVIVFALQETTPQDTTLENMDRARQEATVALLKRENERLAANPPRYVPHDKTAGSTELVQKLSEFKSAIPKLTEATDRYRWGLGTDGKLSDSLRDIDTQAGVMLRYLGVAIKKHPETDGSEFKGYSHTEMQWEALNAAEQITAAAKLAIVADRQKTTSVKTLEFLYVLNGQLLRLRWLTSHLK